IQTRGEGGYALAPGTPAVCHEKGTLFEHISGPPLTELSIITVTEREVLIRCARSFNRFVKDEPRANSGGRPRDHYNSLGSWDNVIGMYKWVLVRQAGDRMLWRRPGKDTEGCSATTGYCSSPKRGDLLYVFSSNASPFEANKSYSKFEAYAFLNFGGDF